MDMQHVIRATVIQHIWPMSVFCQSGSASEDAVGDHFTAPGVFASHWASEVELPPHPRGFLTNLGKH